MRTKILFLFLSVVASLNAAPPKCIIITPVEAVSSAAGAIASALPAESVAVGFVTLSPKGIVFTADSIIAAVSGSGNVGFIGLGIPQSAAAARCAAVSDASFLVMVSATGFPLRLIQERQACVLTYMPSAHWKESAGVRKSLRTMFADPAYSGIDVPWAEEMIDMDPAAILSRIKCPVFVGEGINDNMLSWYDNLVAIEAALPDNPDDCFVALPSTGYCLVKADTSAPVAMDRNPSSQPEPNEEAAQMIADWVSYILSLR